MNSIHLPDPSSWGGAAQLSDLGVLLVQGVDAATFLQGQLSQDMAGMQATDARLAAYCSAKGRMLASMVALRPQPDVFCLLTDAGVLPRLHQRLAMFVMRAKAQLQNASDAMCVVGLVGDAVKQWLGEQSALGEPWFASQNADGQLVRLPDVFNVPRWYWVGPVASAQAVSAALPKLPLPQWQWLDVMSGIPRIEAATVEQFVPQMVNFELVGGVSFKKGCYPGQEVVARSQYRGAVKRRAFVAHAQQPLHAGQEVFNATDPGQPAGMVINAAPWPANPHGQAWSALIELKLNAADDALRAGTAKGASLTLGRLPYAMSSPDSGN